MTRGTIWILAGAVSLAMVAAACASEEPIEPSAEAPAAAAEQPADDHMDGSMDEHADEHMDEHADEHGGVAPGDVPADAQTVEVDLLDFEYSTPTITVEAGHAIAVTVHNMGSAEHDWTVHRADGNEVKGGHVHAMPGAMNTGVFKLKAGTYEVWCTVPGHRELGMVGTLVVERHGH